MDIQEARKQIDEIDEQLCALLEHRMTLSSEIAEYKRRNGLSVLDSGREEKIIARLTLGRDEELSHCIKAVYKELFSESRRLQSRKINGDEPDSAVYEQK